LHELTLDWILSQAAISPDGRHVALAGGVIGHSTLVMLWEPGVDNAKELLRRRVTNRADAAMAIVVAVQFSPDGKRLAFAFPEVSADPESPTVNWTCQILDLATRQVQMQLRESRGRIDRIAFSPTSDRLATCGDSEVTVWDLKTGQRMLEFSIPEVNLNDAAFSPDGQSLAVAIYSPGTLAVDVEWLHLRNLSTGKQETFAFPDQFIAALAFAPTGESLALACPDGLRLADLSIKESPTVVAAHAPTEAWGIAFAPGSDVLATSVDDGLAKLWDAKAGELRRFDCGTLPLKVIFSPKRATLATACYDGEIRLWNQDTGQQEGQLAAHRGPVRCIALDPAGELLASVGDDGAVRLWNVGEQTLERTLGETGSKVHSVMFSPDGQTLFSGDRAFLEIWDPVTGALLSTSAAASAIWALAHSPTEELLAVGTQGPEIELRRSDGRELVFRLAGHTQGVKCLAFSPDGKTLASGSLDQSVRLWHVPTGEELLAFEDLPDRVNGVAFSSDGRTLAATCHDGTVRLWQAK
jgi:WD40 repeat protein